MKQNKIPKNEYIIQPKGKTNPYKHDVIYSDLGQWKYPGQVTRIPSNQITMQGVPYPVQGVDDTGYSQMMYPGMDYQFPGNYVTEYPQMQIGGLIKKGLTAAKKVVKNTYKVNPWAFKPNPEAYYHRSPNLENIINQEKRTLQGFGESEAGKMFTEKGLKPFQGINLQKGANSKLYFAKGTPLDYGRTNKVLDKKTGKMIPGQGYPGPYIVEVEGVPMGVSTKGAAPGAEPTIIGSYAVSKRPVSLNEAKFYKEDWLRGYKPIKIPYKAYGGDPSLPNITGHYQDGGYYNMQRALELGYKPDETEHWPSVDSETGMWLKSKKHPTAWMEYMYGQLDPELAKAYSVRVNPEGYFGDDQLQYVSKKPFGGQNTKTHTHMAQGGWLEEYQVGGNKATYSDSLNLYNNAVELNNFYNNLKPYYNIRNIGEDAKKKETDALYLDVLKRQLKSGVIQKETLKHNQVTENNKNIIKANTDPNIQYISDMVTGAIDPAAPLLRYDKRIEPQGYLQYSPNTSYKEMFLPITKTMKSIKEWDDYDAFLRDLLGEQDYTPAKMPIGFQRKIMSFEDLNDNTKKFIKDKKLNAELLIKSANKDADILNHVPGYTTIIPYYDPIAVKPYNLLTPEEKKIRDEKYPKKEKEIKKEIVDKKKPELITPEYLPMIEASMPNMISQEPNITPKFIFPKQSNIHNRISWRMDPETRKMVPVYLEGRKQKVKKGKRLYNEYIPTSTMAIPEDFEPQFDRPEIVEKTDPYWRREYVQPKNVATKKMGGWLDTMQVGGSRESTSVRKPNTLNATELANVRPYQKLSKEDQMAMYVDSAIANRQPDVLRKTKKQGMGSKAYETIMNPFTAATNLYQYGRLPDNFSQGETNPLDIAPLFINPASYVEAAYNTGKNIINPETYKDIAKTAGAAGYKALGADIPEEWSEAPLNTLFRGLDATMVKGAGKIAKKAGSSLVKKASSSADKNIKNIKQGFGEQANNYYQNQPLPFTYRGVVEKFPGNTSLRNDLAKLKYNFVSQKQNPKLAGTWVNQHEEFMKGRPMSPDATGIIQPPTDPNYLYNFKTYKQPPLEERFKNYKKEDGGLLDDEYRRGGQKRKKYTSKNIQSSVNDIMLRNETLFGPAGKKRYKPGLKYKSGGGWLDNLT